MMQFLKSTLFPENFSKRKKSKKPGDTIVPLEKRIKDLEAQNKDKDKQLEELRLYIQSLAVVISSLANDIQTLASHAISNREKNSQSKDIFSMYKLGDDDDGYLH